jgi:hypothetical protein
MKPAAISDKPRNLDNATTYRMALSLIKAISNKDMASKGTAYQFIELTTEYRDQQK